MNHSKWKQQLKVAKEAKPFFDEETPFKIVTGLAGECKHYSGGRFAYCYKSGMIESWKTEHYKKGCKITENYFWDRTVGGIPFVTLVKKNQKISSLKIN